MAMLADSFLADLDELSDDDEPQQQPGEDGMDADEDEEAAAAAAAAAAGGAPAYDDLSSVAKLASDPHYLDVMRRVREALADPDAAAAARTSALLEDDPTYKLLVECNRLAVDVDNEAVAVHGFLRDRYRPKFPELESLVHAPVDYARLVQRIGNETDLTQLELEDLLPAASVMVVTVTATTTAGRPLPPEQLRKAEEACAMVLRLDDDKQAIIRFVEGRMHQIAPNLSAAVGSEVAARLMGVAGGLLALSKMPACNVQVLGAKRKTLAGYSSATVQPHQGFIYGCALIQQAPPALRAKAARLVGAKCTLLARVDAYGQDPAGETGERMRADMAAKIAKWQEPPPAKTVKPLPAPDAEAKKRRGGRRLRKMKERYGLTDMRKAQNRLNFDFNVPEDEYLDGDEAVGLGQVNKDGSGRLRLVATQQKTRLNARQEKKYKGRLTVGGGGPGGASAVNGLSSTLAFTPVMGFELAAPPSGAGGASASLGGAGGALRGGAESYFSEASGFRSLMKPPPAKLPPAAAAAAAASAQQQQQKQ